MKVLEAISAGSRPSSQALVLDPTDIKLLWSSAKELEYLQPELAKTTFEKITRLMPLSWEASFKIASIEMRFDDSAAAAFWFARALTISPSTIGSMLGLAKISFDREISLRYWSRAKALDPESVVHHLRIGSAYRSVNQAHLAQSSFERAICLAPNDHSAWCEYSATKADFTSLQEAEQAASRARLCDPSAADAALHAGLLAFMKGEFQSAWDLYESRWRTANFVDLPSLRGKPQWQPGMSGRVLVWGEQGLGDELMFLSMLPEILRLVDTVILQIDERLLGLAERWFRNRCLYVGRQQSVASDAYDSQIAIGSLGKHFRATKNSFARPDEPYLTAAPEHVESWRRRLAKERPGYCVGISWRSEHPLVGAAKSVALNKLIVAIPQQVRCVVNLQYGSGLKEKKLFENILASRGFSPEFDLRNDIEQTAALASCCDLIVTVSNSLAHLAGALSIPTILLLRAGGDWRWIDDAGRSIWYPAVRISRQQVLGDWSNCFEEVNKLLSRRQEITVF